MYRFPLPNKIMMKKYAGKVLAATMAVSMMVPMAGTSVLAADVTGTSAQNTNATAKVKYVVEEGYTWNIHSDIDFGKNAGINQNVKKEQNAVQVSKNVIPDGKKLQITVKGSYGTNNAQDGFKIMNGGTTLDYSIVKTGGTEDLTAGGVVMEVDAGTNEKTQNLDFTLNTAKSGAEVAGDYKGIVTYTASIVNKN